ncbi:hypothetical protein CHELA41_24726 [Hyphomicrobiales bacterium]|nr:hypothetical protein CHELA41_24726 [Hyphomicrobiales bacterium]
MGGAGRHTRRTHAGDLQDRLRRCAIARRYWTFPDRRRVSWHGTNDGTVEAIYRQLAAALLAVRWRRHHFLARRSVIL